MPIINIHAIRNEDVNTGELLKMLSNRVAAAFKIDPNQCWSYFTEIRPGEYYEGGVLRESRHSPIVTITAYKGRTTQEIVSALESVADAVILKFGLDPGDVFVTYHEIQPGQVHTGGEVR